MSTLGFLACVFEDERGRNRISPWYASPFVDTGRARSRLHPGREDMEQPRTIPELADYVLQRLERSSREEAWQGRRRKPKGNRRPPELESGRRSRRQWLEEMEGEVAR